MKILNLLFEVTDVGSLVSITSAEDIVVPPLGINEELNEKTKEN